MVVSSLVLWSGAMLGTATSTSVGAFLFWRVVMGVVESLYIPAAYGVIARLHGDRTRSRAFALHQTAQLAGIVAGGWFGGWSAEAIGWRNGYLLFGAAGFVYAAVLFGALRSVPDNTPVETTKGTRPSAVLRSGRYRLLLAATFFFSLILWLIYAWLPDHVYSRFHLSLADSGLIATFFVQASSAAGVLAGGFLADRLRSRRPQISALTVAVGDLLSGPLAWFMLAAGTLTGLKTGALAYGFASGLHVGNIFPAASQIVAPSDYGFAAGMLNLFGGLAAGAGMLLAGSLKDSLGLPFVAASAGLACSAVGLLLAIVSLRRKSERRSTAP
jgi:predicted MFS family arabinose efflux permease